MSRRQKPTRTAHDAGLDELIEAAIVDAHDGSEQIVGFFSMLEEHLEVPFTTDVLGVEVRVERIDVTDDDQIIADCRRGKSRQRVAILDLPLPSPPPSGAEWIEAYRRWTKRGGR